MSKQARKLTSTEAARFLGLRIDYVLLLLRSGRLTGAKANGEWEIDAGSVEAYARSPRVRAYHENQRACAAGTG